MATTKHPVPRARKPGPGMYRRHEREELVAAIRRARRHSFRSAARRTPV